MFSYFGTTPTCDRQRMERQTHDDSIDHASIVWLGKSVNGCTLPSSCIRCAGKILLEQFDGN